MIPRLATSDTMPVSASSLVIGSLDVSRLHYTAIRRTVSISDYGPSGQLKPNVTPEGANGVSARSSRLLGSQQLWHLVGHQFLKYLESLPMSPRCAETPVA
jgi:hypothetical protein